jgi:hypothetical protein
MNQLDMMGDEGSEGGRVVWVVWVVAEGCVLMGGEENGNKK